MDDLWIQSFTRMRDRFRRAHVTKIRAVIIVQEPPFNGIDIGAWGSHEHHYFLSGGGGVWPVKPGEQEDGQGAMYIISTGITDAADAQKDFNDFVQIATDAIQTFFSSDERRVRTGIGVELLGGGSYDAFYWLNTVADFALQRIPGSSLMAEKYVWINGSAHENRFSLKTWKELSPPQRKKFFEWSSKDFKADASFFENDSPVWFCVIEDVFHASADACEIIISRSGNSGAPSQPKTDDMLTVTEAAALAKVDTIAITKAIDYNKQNRLTAIGNGRDRRIAVSDLRKWMQARGAKPDRNGQHDEAQDRRDEHVIKAKHAEVEAATQTERRSFRHCGQVFDADIQPSGLARCPKCNELVAPIRRK